MADVTGSLPPNGSPEGPGVPGTGDDGGVAGSVTGEWVEVYPPDGAPPDEEEQPLDPVPRSRFLPVVAGLFGGSLVLVLLGSVLPLFLATVRFSFRSASTLSVTAWRSTTSSLALDRQLVTFHEDTPVPVGYPLAVAGLLLVVTVGLWLRASWRPSSDRVAKIAGVVAASFLSALVFAIGMFEISWQQLLGIDAGPAAVGGLITGVGQGLWVLVVAALAAIAAAVVSLRVRTEAEDHDLPADEPEPPAPPPSQPTEWPVVAVLPADERATW
jgi:hypothetical protein